VLQCIADAYPKSGLAPATGPERYRLQEWLNFVTSELHKQVFIALLDENSPEGAKQFARDKAGPRLDYLNSRLEGREFLLDRFTVADAYLLTILNWAAPSQSGRTYRLITRACGRGPPSRVLSPRSSSSTASSRRGAKRPS
jgi:glutathione S-transferase